MRKGFTLIEMMISIMILSLMMIFLYQSYASLNISNDFYKNRVSEIKEEQIKKRVLFMDFSLAQYGSINILNQGQKEDVVFLQSSHSIHKRYNPYIAYILKEKKLYRLESLKKFTEYPLSVNDEFVVDFIGDVEGFRLYKSGKKTNNTTEEIYLIHIDFIKEQDILLKVKVLNEV
jgi:prepilin-type N-terminal cleavage/methylation domain-containing protein